MRLNIVWCNYYRCQISHKSAPNIARRNNSINFSYKEPDNYLDIVKSESAINIDNLAGQTRLKYITDVPGQEATYTAKLADATGSTPAQVADLIIATSNQWAIIGAHIEGARQAAKQAIAGAENVVAIRTAVQAFKQVLAPL